MPIRFYVPLPGPFAWIPGKRAPKRDGESTTAATGNIVARILVDQGQRVYDNAHNYAVSKGVDNPEYFANSVLNQVTLHWKAAYGIGLVATLVYWFWQMGFGALIIALVPLLNLVALGIPTLIIGASISAYLNRGDTIHDYVAERLDLRVIGRHRAHK